MKFGQKVSDLVVKLISSWVFVCLYTSSMMAWIVLHISGILNIDNPGFIKWNLWLSYFAGIQASIVLMSTERQSRIDREKQEESVDTLTEQIELLTELVEAYINDHASRNKKETSSE